MSRVVARLTGGFGNQCFLYAAGRGLALKYGAELVLRDSYCADDSRQFALGDFNCSYSRRESRTGRLVKLVDLRIDRWRLEKARKSRSCHVGSHYYDFSDVALELPETLRGTIYLDWFFQSEKFFKKYADQIAADFKLQDDSWLARDPMAARIRRTPNAVFCHVRSYKDAVPDGSMSIPVSYFKNAAAALRAKIDGGTVFLFSDDLEWARERLERSFADNGFEMVPVVGDASLLPQEKYTSGFLRDFTLMRLCRHAIIPNSTFSWWAAWLMEHECKANGETPIVIRPGASEGVKREENPDYWPERWVVVGC